MKANSLAPLLIIFGLFLNLTALFMTIPVLTLYLSEFSLNPTEIGFVDGAIALLGATCSFVVTKKVSKFWTPFWSLVIGDFLIGISYLGFTISQKFLSFLSLACLMGLARALSEPASKTLMAVYPLNNSPELMFRARYICLCLGSLVGPLLGLLVPQKQLIILTTGLIICTYAAILMGIHLLAPKIFGPQKAVQQNLNQKLAFKDKTLRILIIAGCLIYLLFSQYESMVPLSMVGHLENPKTAFSYLMVINAVLGIAFQIPYSKISRIYKPKHLGMLGSILLFCSFVAFSKAQNHMWIWILGACLFTLGESLCLPLGDMLIDQLAPTPLKPSYFSLGELRTLGFFFGPALGGYLLQNLGSQAMYLSGASLALCAGLIYKQLNLRDHLREGDGLTSLPKNPSDMRQLGTYDEPQRS